MGSALLLARSRRGRRRSWRFSGRLCGEFRSHSREGKLYLARIDALCLATEDVASQPLELEHHELIELLVFVALQDRPFELLSIPLECADSLLSKLQLLLEIVLCVACRHRLAHSVGDSTAQCSLQYLSARSRMTRS